MSELPTGTVTFLFTDLEGSTRLWEEHPDAMQGALARHDEILRDAIASNGGHLVKTTGDGFHAAFTTAHDAIGAALDGQCALHAETWDIPDSLWVRMGVHTGEAQHRDGDYYGTALNRAARLMSAAHGGQVLVSGVSASLVADALPDGVTLRELGEYRLRDVGGRLTIFQVVHPVLRAEFPPLRSVEEHPSNLPAPTSSFVGRSGELDSVVLALQTSRLVTLVGVGGVGKTRLALEAAAETLPRFPDGAWLCELAAAGDDDAMVEVMAATLGALPRPDMPLAGSIVEVLRTKRLLVVLDNCEHLMGAASRLAIEILRRCPDVHVLATSREALAIDGEQVWVVRSLELPPPSAPADAVAAFESVQLFAERAGGVRTGFEVEAHGGAVAEICRRLDGIPLAIELAAARVAAMRPAEIATLLDERFRLLTGGRRTAVERHQTLRATVEWSYALLDPAERVVFARLGVFPGSFDAAAATTIVAGDGVASWDVIDALGSLVAKSMVNDQDGPDGTTRYRLLETLRAYAREQLERAGDADRVRHRHAEHYADFAERRGSERYGPDELAWQAWFDAELDNFRAAVTWAMDRSEPGEQGLALVLVAGLAGEVTATPASGVGAWSERVVPLVVGATPGRRFDILGAASWAAFYRGDLPTAEAHAAAAARHGIPADAKGYGSPYYVLSGICVLDGRYDDGMDVLAEGLRSLGEVGSPQIFHGFLLSAEASWSLSAGRMDRAREAAEHGIDIARAVGNPTLLALILALHAMAINLEDPELALAEVEESIALSRAGAAKTVLGLALALSAQLHTRRGDRFAGAQALRASVDEAAVGGVYLTLENAFERAVDVLPRCSYPEAGAVTAGIVDSHTLYPVRRVLTGPELVAYDDMCNEMRVALGIDAFEAAYRRGLGMTRDEAVDFMLHELDRVLVEVGDG